MPFYFRTLDQHGGMEKKVYEVRSLLMAYAQFEVVFTQHAFVRNSLFQEHCYHFILFNYFFVIILARGTKIFVAQSEHSFSLFQEENVPWSICALLTSP